MKFGLRWSVLGCVMGMSGLLSACSSDDADDAANTPSGFFS